MTRSTLVSILLLLALLASPLHAQRDLTDIPDPDPKRQRQALQVADGFEVNLFAADPLIAKPLQMNFDPDGRLWVVCSEVYPQIKPGQVANDKVLILEDTTGDGTADTTTVFADGLLIPTGIEPGDGGAYVANSTELIHLKDTTGDGRADTRRVVLSGFGTEDTHHILHTFRWGYDGHLYFNQSTYIHSHIETPHGPRRLGGGGIWRFRPESMALDVFVRGLINPWGLHFDRFGQTFATDGAGSQGINYLIPGGAYAWAVGVPRVLDGLNPGSPKHCGAEVVSGRHLPDDWQGNILTCDFRAHRVCRFVLSEDGSGFAAREEAELITSSHVAFRPIDVKMGPDGAIYIADWYNPIIQHGEVDFRDPRRDQTRGRIWRVTARGRPLVERPKLADAAIDELLDALKAPEDWTRHQAKRVLKERGAEAVLPALASWVEKLGPSNPESDHHRLEALWTYQALDHVEPVLLETLLASTDHRIRAAAARVAGDWHARLSDPIARLARRVADDHPRVRLEAVRALARVPEARAVEVALGALDAPTDRFLDYALWLTARELAPFWLGELTAGRLDFGGNARHLVFALDAVHSPEVVEPLWAWLRDGKIPASEQDRALTLVATLGDPAELGLVFDLAVSDEARTPSQRAGLLSALMRATEQRRVRPEGDLSRLTGLLDADDATLQAVAARAGGLWGVRPMRPGLIALMHDDSAALPVREAAIDGLARLGGIQDRETLDRFASEANIPRALRRRAVVALTSLDVDTAARRALRLLADDEADPETDTPALMNPLLQRPGGPEALTAALADRDLPPNVAKLAVRAVRTVASASAGGPRGRRESSDALASLIEALTRAGGLSETDEAPTLSDAQMRAMVAEVVAQGNPQRGEAIFRRAELACLKCHAIGGAGGLVGPDLSSIGTSAPIDYLIESILLPEKVVKENYHALVVATDDGRILTGVPFGQTDTELILRDAEDQELRIPLSSIEEQRLGGSLMPAGLTDSLTRSEFVDLVRFLSELGKAGGPYAVGQDRAVRSWEVLQPTSEAVLLLIRNRVALAAQRVAELPWTPAYSTVSGSLPLDDLPEFTIGENAARFGFARCQIDVPTAGPVRLRLNATDGLSLWLDGQSVAVHEEMTLDLPPGRHTLTFAVALDRRDEGLRLSVHDIP